MSKLTSSDPLLLDALYGVPGSYDPPSDRQPRTVEWLLAAVQRHADAEAGSLHMYEELAQTSGDPVVTLVMRLILDDEERHHGLLRRIEATLGDALDWTHSPAALPSTVMPQAPLPEDLVARAKQLIAEEHAGARKMRELADRERSIDSGLERLLLRMMAMDSDKHAALLEFVRDRLAARPRTVGSVAS